MNNIYKTSIAVVLFSGLFSMGISAQTAKKDTTLNRQVNLEREYTPTIKDASKVNTLPSLHRPEKKQYDIRFENAIPTVDIHSYPIGNPGSGNIQTNIDYSKHRGYFRFGAGMYTNLEGALGYRIVDGENDRLDLFATHSFSDARIKYLDDTEHGFDKIKAKDMENMVKLRYSHKFESADWYLGGSFLNNQYNYYGNPNQVFFIGGGNISPDDEEFQKKQSVSNIEIETGIQSKESENITYSGNLTYNRFTAKYGPDTDYDGPKANLVDARVDLLFPFMDSFKAGVKGGVFYQGTADVDFGYEDDDLYRNLTVLNANPYIKVGGDNFLLSLGLNLSHAFDLYNKSLIAPTAKINWNFQEKSMFYLNLDGGINNNNLLYIYRQNKYINPVDRVAISRTPYDVKAGIKSGAVGGFEFDVFAGYKYTKNQYLFVPGATTSWHNVSDVLYADMGTGHLGGSVSTKLIPYTDLSLALTGLFYNVKEYTDYNPGNGYLNQIEKKPWGLPSVKFGLNADFTFIENLILTASYDFEGGRKTYLSGESVKMDAINELSFKANYSVLDWFSVYARANNVLNQKYERFYGYTLQGISILGGVSLKF